MPIEYDIKGLENTTGQHKKVESNWVMAEKDSDNDD
jgi:hypothetical protein